MSVYHTPKAEHMMDSGGPLDFDEPLTSYMMAAQSSGSAASTPADSHYSTADEHRHLNPPEPPDPTYSQPTKNQSARWISSATGNRTNQSNLFRGRSSSRQRMLFLSNDMRDTVGGNGAENNNSKAAGPSPRSSVLLSLPHNTITAQSAAYAQLAPTRRTHPSHNQHRRNHPRSASALANAKCCPLYRQFEQSTKNRRLLLIVAALLLVMAVAVVLLLVLWALQSAGSGSSARQTFQPLHDGAATEGERTVTSALMSQRWQLPQCSSVGGGEAKKCRPYVMKGTNTKTPDDEELIAAQNHWSGVQPVEYEIELNFLNLNRSVRAPAIDYENKLEFSGVVRLHFRVIEPTSRIIVHRDARSIHMNGVEVTTLCGTKTFCVDQVTYEEKGDHFTIITAEVLQPGEHYTLKMVYDAVNVGYKAGLYVTQTASSLGLSTIFQMRYARLVLPCLDVPSLKAKFSLCTTHKTQHLAVSNSPQRSVSSQGDVSMTCFERTVPLPTYVFSFSVLDNYINETLQADNPLLPDLQVLYTHDMVTNPPQWLLPEAAERLQRLLDMTKQTFVMPKIDILLQPTPYWGIENMGLIAIDSYHTAQPQYALAHTILTHEVIHMWLGNLFTISTWSQICLQEGLTAYLEWVITDETHLKDLRTVIETKFPGSIADSESPPIIRPFGLTQQIADYCFAKPPLVFHMMRAAFGDNLWFDFMAAMSQAYAFDHAGLEQWATVLNRVAGDDRAGEMLRVWFTAEGFPLILVERTIDGSIRLQQKVVLNNTVVQPVKQPFPFRVNYLDQSGHELSEWMSASSLVIPPTQLQAASQQPDYHFVFDANMNVFGRFIYSAENYDVLLNSCIRNRPAEAQGGRANPTSGWHCQLDLHQINFLLDDLCWAIEKDVVPLNADDESADVWSSVLATIVQFSRRGSAQRLISVNSLCSCCVKTAEEILDEPGRTPWNPGCRFTWNRTCRHRRLMQHLNRTQEIDDPSRSQRRLTGRG